VTTALLVIVASVGGAGLCLVIAGVRRSPMDRIARPGRSPALTRRRLRHGALATAAGLAAFMVTRWPVAIALGGHVRVGWEDNPYMPDGSLSKTNAEQVEVAVQMAKVAGREVATAAEAREIMGLDPRPARVPMH